MQGFVKEETLIPVVDSEAGSLGDIFSQAVELIYFSKSKNVANHKLCITHSHAHN